MSSATRCSPAHSLSLPVTTRRSNNVSRSRFPLVSRRPRAHPSIMSAWHTQPRYNDTRVAIKKLTDGRGDDLANGLVPQLEALLHTLRTSSMDVDHDRLQRMVIKHVRSIQRVYQIIAENLDSDRRYVSLSSRSSSWWLWSSSLACCSVHRDGALSFMPATPGTPSHWPRCVMFLALRGAAQWNWLRCVVFLALGFQLHSCSGLLPRSLERCPVVCGLAPWHAMVLASVYGASRSRASTVILLCPVLGFPGKRLNVCGLAP